ncbi:MAG: DUF47 family protein [Paludibacteraceae bacterium]|nr:DUF47 family protein [Paludibacteraceae bacterium]
MSAKMVEGADLFTEFVATDDHDKRVELYTKIKAVETECDHLVVDIYDIAGDSFVIPFDREDVHQLCGDMDDVMDYINDASKRILLYNPKTRPEKALHMAEIILEGAKAIDAVCGELKTMTKHPAMAQEQCAKLHDLEHEGDDVYDNFVKELFESDMDTKELIKSKEIMQSMESATDMANHVGKTLLIIIAKYA